MPASGSQRLGLQLLGGFRLHDDAGAEIKVVSRKGRALLAYLALRPGEAHTRDRLATLLWEDADEDLARTSLRQALAAVRKSLPDCAGDALIADSDSVALDPQVVRVDIALLRSSLTAGTRAALQEVIGHYRGDLLDGFDARSSAFDEWVNSERLALRREVGEALSKLTSLCIANDDTNGALTACTRLVALEPLNEAAHRTIMELHARRNAYAEALRQYRVCRSVLRRELDVAPESATEALYRELMRRRRAATGRDDGEDAPLTEENAAPTPSAAAKLESRPQLRDATILVARLDGLLELEARLDPEEAHTLSLEFQNRVQRAAQEFGGQSDRRVGASVLAVFGVPTSYGNEAERAVRAAQLLQDAISREPWPRGHARLAADMLQLRIGIAQGQVLCGAGLFPLTGRPAHMAHTLAAGAGISQILIAEDVRNALDERFVTKRASMQSVPGAEPMPAWLVQSANPASPGASRPFVGRRPELAMTLAALDRCMGSRHGRALVIRGEAGIGKTRLADTVRSIAAERGVATHSARVFDFGQSPGRRPITTLALSLLGVPDDAAPAQRAAAVRKAVAAPGSGSGIGIGIDQIIFVSDLIDAPLDPELAALEKAMAVATRQRGRTLALAQLIETAARRTPLLLIVEDVHWADSEEIARLGEIAAVVANCPILFIMTTRPEGDPINAAWRARARGCPVTTVDLAPLADDEAQEMAVHYPQLSPETIAACVRRAEGYPLFLDQLLRAASAGHDTLPGSVRSLVLARADRLSAQDHGALQAGAVLGHRFALDALRRMIDNPDFEPAALVETTLVRYDGEELEFAHALFRDALYESILKSHRRDLHRHAAEWFADRDAALYADHLAAAEDEHAAQAYADAARAEQAALRFERSLTLASKANALAREPAMLHETSRLLGELLLQLGRTHDALTAYREALDFAFDQNANGQAWFGIAAALRIMDRHEEALDALDRAESALDTAADMQMRARLYTLRGNLCFPLGRFDACLSAHEYAYALADQANCPIEAARSLGGLGDAWYQRGRMATARDYFARCVDAARRNALPGVLLANLPMLCITRIYCGELEAAQPDCKEAQQLARQIGDVRGQLLVSTSMATGSLVSGDYEEASASAKRAQELARQIGARRFHAESLGIIAASLLARGERESALMLAEEGLRMSRDTGLTYCGPTLMSLVARATPDAKRRADLLAEGEALLATGCVSHTYFEFYSNAIEVSLQDGLWDNARLYAERLAAYTREEPVTWTELIIRRAYLLADVGAGSATADTQQTLASLRATVLQTKFLALLPSIDNALQSLAA